MTRSTNDRMTRTGACVLALVMWLAPLVQVYAGTLAEGHCGAHGHLSPLAAEPAHDSTDAAHHAGAATDADHGSTTSDDGDEQCTCDCLCGLACTPGAALLPALPMQELAAPEHTTAAPGLVPPHAIHSVPQRPPVSSELMA